MTGGCYSERGGQVEDVHRAELHPGMLAVARGGGRLSAGYPAWLCRGFTAKIRALHVASRAQTKLFFIGGIPWIWFCWGFFKVTRRIGSGLDPVVQQHLNPIFNNY